MRTGRPKKYSSNAEKQKAYRQALRNGRSALLNSDREKASRQVVLSLFPGADLLGRAFEQLGFCVVRGPELLLGQDIRDFHVPREI